MSEKTLREACEALKRANEAYDTHPLGQQDKTLNAALMDAEVAFADATRTLDDILVALDAEAAKADAAGYERGRREALEEVQRTLASTLGHAPTCQCGCESAERFTRDGVARMIAFAADMLETDHD